MLQKNEGKISFFVKNLLFLYLTSLLLNTTQKFSWIFTADRNEELEKEKESQNVFRKRIEQETKNTGIIYSYSEMVITAKLVRESE